MEVWIREESFTCECKRQHYSNCCTEIPVNLAPFQSRQCVVLLPSTFVDALAGEMAEHCTNKSECNVNDCRIGQWQHPEEERRVHIFQQSAHVHMQGIMLNSWTEVLALKYYYALITWAHIHMLVHMYVYIVYTEYIHVLDRDLNIVYAPFCVLL